MTRAREATAARIALAAQDERTAGEIAAVAAARGLRGEPLLLAEAVDAPVGAIAYVPAAPPDAAAAAELAPLCLRAAENRRPVVLLAAFERARGRVAEERAIALAWLRAHGAIVISDPDVWFETTVLIAAWGPPPGSRTALVAPPGGWLHLAATALAQDEGARLPAPDDSSVTDLVLVDGNLGAPGRLPEPARAAIVPVVARAEHLPSSGPIMLVGLRAALAAAAHAAAFAERLSQGLGPAPVSEAKKLRPDRDKIDKALARAGDLLGDHESKLLLAAYGVPVIRQGVATTPSAAVRIAGICGWPVEVKPWAPESKPEREGGPLSTNVKNAPDVRRAFADVAGQAGLDVGVPVIVRVTPPAGRDLAVRVEEHGQLGWTVLLDLPGRPLAAPAPLRRCDADELAGALEANRGGDAAPDRAALAELLVRASFCVVDREADVESLELGRVVVSARNVGAQVVDARTRLRKKRARPSAAP